MKCDIINLDKKAVGSLELADEVFGAKVRKDILARVIQWQLDKRRAGTHAVKTVGEVSGRGSKPHQQKGSGRARLGQIRAPQMRHGGVVFGPVVRSHAYALNKKIRALGLKMALSEKVASGNFFVLDSMAFEKPQTKILAQSMQKNGWESVLFIGAQNVDENFYLSVQNVVKADIMPVQGANVYDIVRKSVVVLTKEAVEALEGRLK